MNINDKITVKPLDGGYQESFEAVVKKKTKTMVFLEVPDTHKLSNFDKSHVKFSIKDGLLVGYRKNEFPKWSIC